MIIEVVCPACGRKEHMLTFSAPGRYTGKCPYTKCNRGIHQLTWGVHVSRGIHGLYVESTGAWCEECRSCHITKVVCYGLGLPDNCHELEELRRFRDVYLNKEGYSSEVEDYYKNSFIYASHLERRAKNDPNLYKWLFETYILPAVKLIESNNMKEAHKILREYLNYVKESYASEVNQHKVDECK